jgi:hypothetical protein
LLSTSTRPSRAEASANLYSEFADVVAERISGRRPPVSDTLFPGIEGGVKGLAFVAAAVGSAQTARWISVAGA